MTKRIRESLVLQLGIFAGIIMLVLAGAFGMTNWYINQSLRKGILESNHKILSQTADRIEEFRETLNHIAISLIYSPTIYDYFGQDSVDRVMFNEGVVDVFQNTMLLEEDILRIYLYDSNMRQIANMGSSVENIGEFEFENWEKDKLEFGNMIQLDQTRIPCYKVYLPVFDLNNARYGQKIGMCVMVMGVDGLNSILEDAHVTEHAEIYILDASNQIVAKNTKKAMMHLEPEKMKSGAGYYVEMQEPGINGWKIISRIPENELNDGKGYLKNYVIAAYVLAILLMILLVYFCYKRMVMPMRAVASFVKEVTVKPEKRMYTKRRDELQTVTGNLNQMLDEKEEMVRKIQQSQKKMYEIELAKKQLQILAYQNQINPHFLYNTLDCIRAMALYYDVDVIADIVMALSKVFRFAVKGKNIVTVEEEVNYIREYAKIIKCRFMGKIKVHIFMEEEIRNKKMIKLLLQPLVENAVFHGLEKKVDGGTVEVRIRRKEDGFLIFEVMDDGCGMDVKRLEELKKNLGTRESRNGIGMSNIYQRLQIFYGEKMQFYVQSMSGEGTMVTVVIPDDIREDKERNV